MTGFSRGNPNAYSAAIKLGIKEAVQVHMKKSKHGMGNEQVRRETPEQRRREKMKND